jgi:hypothetical protein
MASTDTRRGIRRVVGAQGGREVVQDVARRVQGVDVVPAARYDDPADLAPARVLALRQIGSRNGSTAGTLSGSPAARPFRSTPGFSCSRSSGELWNTSPSFSRSDS